MKWIELTGALSRVFGGGGGGSLGILYECPVQTASALRRAVAVPYLPPPCTISDEFLALVELDLRFLSLLSGNRFLGALAFLGHWEGTEGQESIANGS
jgi:hypothetical protein